MAPLFFSAPEKDAPAVSPYLRDEVPGAKPRGPSAGLDRARESFRESPFPSFSMLLSRHILCPGEAMACCENGERRCC